MSDVLIPWRAVSVVVPIWLALVFGRTLRAGDVPLIERIARVSASALPPALCRYTRRLTAVWCAYFAIAALLPLTVSLPFGGTSALVWSGMAVLFVGEHRLRAHLFPGQDFPGLMQQLRDTWSVWRLGL
ncbi:MAG: hypothetical protein ACSLEZ_10310 [Thiobacillus sp.]